MLPALMHICSMLINRYDLRFFRDLVHILLHKNTIEASFKTIIECRLKSVTYEA